VRTRALRVFHDTRGEAAGGRFARNAIIELYSLAVRKNVFALERKCSMEERNYRWRGIYQNLVVKEADAHERQKTETTAGKLLTAGSSRVDVIHPDDTQRLADNSKI